MLGTHFLLLTPIFIFILNNYLLSGGTLPQESQMTHILHITPFIDLHKHNSGKFPPSSVYPCLIRGFQHAAVQLMVQLLKVCST